MSNNANLIKKLRNNSWDKPVVTVAEAEKIVAHIERSAYNDHLDKCDRIGCAYPSFEQFINGVA
jgi:hypothetical protein